MISTKYRSTADELMDDFTMEGDILRDALDKIAKINQLLGGNSLTLRGVDLLLQNVPVEQKVTIVDVGCGNGDMLRAIAEYMKRSSRKVTLIGIDANDYTIRHAKALSMSYPNISYRCEDIFDEAFDQLNYDIVLCTLTLHHFKDDEITKLMRSFYDNASTGIVINDLQRSAVAYYLFKMVCFIFGLNKMSRDDGLVSILRGFKRGDLEEYSRKCKFKNYSISWKWAFRYQWIIRK
jgi:2-polyprenyl-3-methyl-5-hydroxy-6-metoxy-1,4-benzoquinol methylase